MRVIVDAYGGDNAPDAVLQGCRMAADPLEVRDRADPATAKSCVQGRQSWAFLWRI